MLARDRLKGFDKGIPLAKDLAASGVAGILMEVLFPSSYPLYANWSRLCDPRPDLSIIQCSAPPFVSNFMSFGARARPEVC